MSNKIHINVNKAMAALNLSSYKLAAIAGVSVSAVYNLQEGSAPSAPNTYAKIITALNAKIDPDLFIKSIKAKKEALNLSNIDLSKLAGVSHRTLYRIESDRAMPSIKTCCRIARKLSLPLEDLIEWSSK